MSIIYSILESWQSHLFLLAGVFRGISIVPLFTDVWQLIENNMKPFITIIILVISHLIECCLRIPFLMTSEDITTRYQPVIFAVLFGLLTLLYIISYMNPKATITGKDDGEAKYKL